MNIFVDAIGLPMRWQSGLEDGRCVSWSVSELAQRLVHELLDPNAREAYYAMGKEFDHFPLGMLPDETFDAYRGQPGTLEEPRRLISLAVARVQSEHVRLLSKRIAVCTPRSVEALVLGLACR